MEKGIVFENIDTKETVLVSRSTEGKHYRAKLSAIMNSSNMSPNADRGQDYGWRLQPEQQATLEAWESDPDMIDRVSTFCKVPSDTLTHAEFLTYYLYQLELGHSPEKAQDVLRRENQLQYNERVAAIRAQTRPEPVAPFKNREDATLDDFLNGDLTGDAGGDKIESTVEQDIPKGESASTEISKPPVKRAHRKK